MTFKIEEYEIIVSIGIRCIPSIAMADLKIKQDTYTFDWTQSNPQVVLDCIKDNFIKYNNFNFDKINNLYDLNLRYPKDFEKSFDNKFINEYGMCFTHYTNLKYDEFKNLCNRRSKKFMELLTSTKKILFVYVSTEKIELQIKQYNYLIEFEKYLLNNYPKLNFKIL